MIHPRHFYYLLDKMRNVIECRAPEELELLLRDPDRKIVKQEEIDGMFVSTVFLGIDHYFGDNKDHPPVVFETMVFDRNSETPNAEIYRDRYCTWEEAEEGHREAVRFVKEGCVHEDEAVD